MSAAASTPVRTETLTVGVSGVEPSLVVLHGFGDAPADMEDLARAVAPRGRSAVLPRLRCGDSVPDDRGWSPAHLAGDVHTECRSLARHAVVGYSFGGTVAAVYALLRGPRRVSSLVVVDQAFGAQPDRIEPEPWSLASDLLWHDDRTHHLLAAARVGIPTLLVLGSSSHVVPSAEAEQWLAVDEPGLLVVEVTGDHRELLEPGASSAAVIADFLTRTTEAQ